MVPHPAMPPHPMDWPRLEMVRGELVWLVRALPGRTFAAALAEGLGIDEAALRALPRRIERDRVGGSQIDVDSL